VLAVAGCGGGHKIDPVVVSLDQSAAWIAVDQALVKLSGDVLNGGNLLHDSEVVVGKLRSARNAGLSEAWIDRQISDAEDSATLAGCADCFSLLESAR
jgi:hypothetical protein